MRQNTHTELIFDVFCVFLGSSQPQEVICPDCSPSSLLKTLKAREVAVSDENDQSMHRQTKIPRRPKSIVEKKSMTQMNFFHKQYLATKSNKQTNSTKCS